MTLDYCKRKTHPSSAPNLFFDLSSHHIHHTPGDQEALALTCALNRGRWERRNNERVGSGVRRSFRGLLVGFLLGLSENITPPKSDRASSFSLWKWLFGDIWWYLGIYHDLSHFRTTDMNAGKKSCMGNPQTNGNFSTFPGKIGM